MRFPNAAVMFTLILVFFGLAVAGLSLLRDSAPTAPSLVGLDEPTGRGSGEAPALAALPPACPGGRQGGQLTDDALGPVVGAGSLAIDLDSIEDAVEHAETIIHGQIVGFAPGRENDRIGFHDVVVDVFRVIKGDDSLGQVRFERPACHLPTGRKFELEGALYASVGQEIVALLSSGVEDGSRLAPLAGVLTFLADEGVISPSARSSDVIDLFEDGAVDVATLEAAVSGAE